MPKYRTTEPAKIDKWGRVRILLTLTPEQSALVDRARGFTPASTYARVVLLDCATAAVRGEGEK